MKINDNKMTLKQYMELPIVIVGKVCIYPPARPGENIIQAFERREHFNDIHDEEIKRYQDCYITQIFTKDDEICFILWR